MDERARLALACSRASGKLFILGDRNALEEEEMESGDAERSVLAQIADLQDLDLSEFFPDFEVEAGRESPVAAAKASFGGETRSPPITACSLAWPSLAVLPLSLSATRLTGALLAHVLRRPFFSALCCAAMQQTTS